MKMIIRDLIKGESYLAVAFTIGIVHFPEESRTSCGRLAPYFEVGGDGVTFQQSLRRTSAGFEA